MDGSYELNLFSESKTFLNRFMFFSHYLEMAFIFLFKFLFTDDVVINKSIIVNLSSNFEKHINE